MHAQLEQVIAEFESAHARLRALAGEVATELWARRPAPERWSIGECVAHLNLTSAAFLPLLRAGIERARALGVAAPKRYGRGLLGWMLWKSVGPPARFRMKTTPPFVPPFVGHGAAPPAALVAEFERLQAEQVAIARAADGLPIERVKIASPFDARLK